jgi:hypothetical protein
VTTPWRDTRLWTGIALVAGSIALGARVLSGADDMTQVWAARADLQPGAQLSPDDLVVARVRLDDAASERYLLVDGPLPEEDRLVRAVGQGELVPAAALGVGDLGVVAVPVSVPARAVPPSLAAGSVVPAVDEMLGAGGDRQVVVGVPADARGGVGRVLAAGRDGRVAITREG